MKTTILLLSAFLVIATNNSCRKQVVQQATDHFMLSVTALMSNNDVRLDVDYNNSGQNIIVIDTILVKRAGLYHFEGKLFVQGTVINAAAAGFCKMTFTVFPDIKTYDLFTVFTTPIGGSASAGEANYSMDIYLQANSRIKLRKRIQNLVTTSGEIYGHFGGYRKSN